MTDSRMPNERANVEHVARRIGAELDDVNAELDRQARAELAAAALDDEPRIVRSVFTVSLAIEHDARSQPNTIALELERFAHVASPAWRGSDGRDRRVTSALVTEQDVER